MKTKIEFESPPCIQEDQADVKYETPSDYLNIVYAVLLTIDVGSPDAPMIYTLRVRPELAIKLIEELRESPSFASRCNFVCEIPDGEDERKKQEAQRYLAALFERAKNWRI